MNKEQQELSEGADLIATLKAAAERAIQGQWLVRPDRYDDWGVIRSAQTGWIVAKAQSGCGYTQDDLNLHRSNGTDPYGANAQHIAAASPENILKLLTLFTAKDALIASLKESLQSTLDRESATTARYDAKIEALEAEILKQNKAEDELLATGEKLAEERDEK